MKKIIISDASICTTDTKLSFKEKTEIVRQLDKMGIDKIELPKFENVRTDSLFVGTVAPLLSHAALSLSVGYTAEEIAAAGNAIKNIPGARLKVSVPVSTVCMEYSCHKKAATMPDFITKLFDECKKYTDNIEFCAEDATRADEEFLIKIIKHAIAAGAKSVCICDDAGIALPAEISAFIKRIKDAAPELSDVGFAVAVNDNIHMATACSFAAVEAGVNEIKTKIRGGSLAKTGSVVSALRARSDFFDAYCDIIVTEFHRSEDKILQILAPSQGAKSLTAVNDNPSDLRLDKNDDIKAVEAAVRSLGYDLDEEDINRIYTEFCTVAENKDVSAGELEAIIASTALQVPPTYTLSGFLISTSSFVAPSAQIILEKDGEKAEAIGSGDGSVDAAFKTIEIITGHHYELDDFQISSVTRGHEAVGNAVVRLRNGGKLYSGSGISTDIIEASIKAYISALNKIVYEEN